MHLPAVGWCRVSRNGAKSTQKFRWKSSARIRSWTCAPAMPMSGSVMRAGCRPIFSHKRFFATRSFLYVVRNCLRNAVGRDRTRRGSLKYSLIHFDWTSHDREAPTWARWLSTACSIDPSIPEIHKPWDPSFREELHASGKPRARERCAHQGARAFVAGLRLYLVSVPDHPRRSDIEAFSAWMTSIV
jgi:hypothetical protein